MKFAVSALAGALAFASAAHAQAPGQISARNPAGMVTVLEGAGYSPKLTTDSTGDPMIDMQFGDYQAMVLFYGCDEAHANCDSVQLRAGFDREEPWTAEKALDVAKKYRFASIWLDVDGDPWVQWDIMTGAGIPSKVFLDSVETFGSTIEDTAKLVFEDE